MSIGRLQGPISSLQEPSFKLPSVFQSKVVAPRNPKLTRDEGAILMLTPSAFLREMSLTTEQKLANTREMHPPRIIHLLDMSETSHQKFSSVDLDQALFQPFPSEIVFQNYTACETYEVPLMLRNNDKVPRLVKVIQENSPYFQIISPNDVCHKVAPGMASTFRILFTPEENKDYFHELVCITEREKFVVPIKAVGARALLDFPDQLNFLTCPVKYNSQKALLVRNIGNREACFKLLTQRPFSVDPISGTLAVGESMQVIVEFQPHEVGDHSQDLTIHYDTGEDVYVSLYGAAIDINIRLDKNSLIIEKTFLSLANQRTVTISNRSDIIAHFQWKAFASSQEEEQQKQRFYSGLQIEEEEETDRFLEECSADPSLRERLTLLSRTFHNRRRMAQGDTMLFSDDIFQVEPVEGDVWPNSSVEVNVIFKPRVARPYQCTIYCDITGRETRLPLRIRGEGLGPKLTFNYDHLDIGKIFVGSTHSYEVILANPGAIDGIFVLIPSSTAVGSCFTFSPSEGIVLPSGHQAIEISVSCNILGEFNQEFHFSVDGCPEDISLTVRGCIIGPTFHFSLPSLHFGDVSFGFPHTLTCCLNNTSLVPMTYKLRVPGDGDGEPSITSTNQILDNRRSSWRKGTHANIRAQEFSITPSHGTIRSQGLLEIEVTLCSNYVKTYELALVVDVEGIGDEVLALPITARCVVPTLLLENSFLHFNRCFLQHPYQKAAILVNSSNLHACYGLLPQETDASSPLLYDSPRPCGIIQPQSSVEVPIEVQIQVTGEQHVKAHIAVFGSKDPALELSLFCIGEGPVVHVCPSEMDFGDIKVLTDISKTLELRNQSLIPARFQASIMGKFSRWRVDPSSGEIPPEGVGHLTLVAHLNDTIQFNDKVQLIIENSNTYLIPLQATGIGTTIVTDRTFAPVLNLGTHFSSGPCCYRFTMSNRGRRSHLIHWISDGFSPFRKRTQLPSIKSASSNTDIPGPVFKISPSRMELRPGQSIDVVLEGFSDTPKVVKERLIGFAIIGKQTGKHQIMTVDIICEFIAPVLHLSARQLHFTVQKQPDNELTQQYQPLMLRNISSLPLTLFLSVKYPFSIFKNEVLQNEIPEQPYYLAVGGQMELSISFDPTYIQDLRSEMKEEVLMIRYAEHPHTDYVSLQGVVDFPNLHIPNSHINFGCILNASEASYEMEITNNSPMFVHFLWSHQTKIRETEVQSPETDKTGCIEENTLDIWDDVQCQDQHEDLGQKVFSITPLSGTLQPGEKNIVGFTFHGHTDIRAQAKAKCEVFGGPTYEITLQGETSHFSYTLDTTDIDYGLQLFDQVSEAEIVLRNTGRVSFPFTVLYHNTETILAPNPGEPLIHPVSGLINAGEEQVLKVLYFPGVPGSFHQIIQIQVAHLKPESVTLRGEGVFPRICLDLPRKINENESLQPYLKEAEDNIREKKNVSNSLVAAGSPEPIEEHSNTTTDTLLLMEVECLLIKEHAKNQLQLEVLEDDFQGTRSKLLKASLPDYLLDFGFVILGEVRTHVFKITNNGHLPVSFHADRRGLNGTGFSTELDRVKNLPCFQTETFQVKFDPRGANLNLGLTEVVMPIQVSGGPRFSVRITACVTMPSLTVSSDKVEFDDVQCGQCQVKSVQLYNQLPVLCEWTVMTQEKDKIDKHMPAYLRKKLRHDLKSKAVVFEMLPSAGVLLPGQRVNVQIRFMPQEEKLYSQRLLLQVAQSSQRVMLMVQGQGLEPRLEFTPSVLELGPILPFSQGEEAEVLVRNPCSFPIEFYSLEMDKQYLEEEKMLRMLKAYDSQNTLLLPPRLAGEKLPTEILDYYEEQKRLQEDASRKRGFESHESGGVEEDHSSDMGVKQEHPPAEHIPTNSCDDGQVEGKPVDAEEELAKRAGSGEKILSSKAVGELDNNPISLALARHLGIDTSSEGRAARNRRGIAIIVYGAPLTGKSSAAVSLAKHYNIACLSIDAVIMESISDGNSRFGLRARQLCAKAALEQARRESEGAGSQVTEALGGQTSLSVEALAKHTAEGGQVPENKTATQSVLSRGNKGSLVTGKGKSESHAVQGGKLQHVSDTAGSQTESTALPGGPIQRRLSVSASVAGELGLMSCVLPEELLQEILSERLQLNDCFQGVVFDGLETLFARNVPSALHTLLKALNNRKHIYFINLYQEYAVVKAREKAQKEKEEKDQLSAQEQEKAHMEEMDEEEYDNLPADERARIDELRLIALQERRKREKEERLAREENERRVKEEMLKQKEEEEMRKKKTRGKSREETSGKKSQLGGKQGANISSVKNDQRLNSALERKASVRDRPDSVVNEYDLANKKHRTKELRNGAGDPSMVVLEDAEVESMSEKEKQLMQNFIKYESFQKDVLQILTLWDRVQGILHFANIMEDSQHEGENQAPERQVASHKKNRKERERLEKLEREKAEKDQLEREKAEKERLDKLKSTENEGVLDMDKNEERVEKVEMGIPHFDFQVCDSIEPIGKKIIQSRKLPSIEEILDGLGLGPSGPPIPPPSLFSVVPYPETRTLSTDQDILGHFTFIAASPDDPNVIPEVKKEPESESDPALGIPMLKEEQVTPTKSRSRKEKTADTGRESRRRSASDRKKQQNLESRSSPPGTTTPLSDLDQGSSIGDAPQEKLIKLGIFRWVVPAGGEVPLRIHFASNSVGNFDQTLNFELLGTHRRYQLYCRGVCAFPAICSNPKVVFPHRKKEAKPDEIVHKKFVMSAGTFDFGPLFCGKSRDKYKAGQYPENMEKITIHNASPMESEVTFCFQHDVKAVTFILDPPAMTLKPNEKQELCIWAFPTSPGLFEDNIVCCTRDNPEPAIFHICCRGVRPELELDRKQIHFDKILLHRRDTKTIFLRNSTLLPVAWRVTGLENLGDEFSVSQDQGIIAPRSECGLQLHFKAAKASNIKKNIRLEVSDVENILGIVQLENIQITAEAYDVALDISFPKGTDGGLDFGVVKVLEEAKHTISLKNKGKYEIGFSFFMESIGHRMPDVNSIFSILPQKGTLGPTDRGSQVQIIFNSKEEVEIMDKPILRCQVIEPNLSEGGETIASIPIRISARSVFSKYRLCPSLDINFGAMVLGSRKLCSFTLENCGLLEFRYNISKMVREVVIQPAKKGPGGKRARSREDSGSSKSFGKGKRSDPQQREMSVVGGQARFSLGMFTMSPGFGVIPPGGHQVINVECFADQMGKSEEILAIDISDRNPEDHPNGIPYQLVTEVCTPGFVTDDIGNIFEEHRILRDARIVPCLQSLQAGGVYLQEENQFMFCNVLVGQTSTARFKIQNNGRVPCDVVLTVKPINNKSAARINEIFDVFPPRMNIPSHSHCFASVTFTPRSMHAYQCIFEAAIDGIGSVISKTRNLTFEISGEGNLPRVTILRPVLRNKRGSPLMLFQRLLLGQCQMLPLMLKNDGTISAQLHIDMQGDGGEFTLKPKPSTCCIYPSCSTDGEPTPYSTVRRAHTASLNLHPGDTAEFEVLFRPTSARRFENQLRLSVLDNQYEQNFVQLVGEGYQEELTLDNIPSPGEAVLLEGPLEDDLVQATRTDHIYFGDCHVGKQYQVTFTMTNHSMDAMRFEWPSEAPLSFSPQMGHLHSGCAKDVTVTLKSDAVVAISKSPVKCIVSRISFPMPLDQVADWDDRMRTVRWVDANKSPGTQHPAKRKMIETDPEPAHVLLDELSRELELLVSAMVDYAQYQAKCEPVQFKDTLLYQTRVYKYQMQNPGSVKLHFSWQIDMEQLGKSVSFSPRRHNVDELPTSARSSSIQSRPPSVMESVSSLLSMGAETLPFSVQPNNGFIPIGGTQEFLIKFSPTEVGEFEGRLTCSIPNLQKDQQEPVLPVKGRSLLPFCHFQLEDSDYISHGRRNPELQGPFGAPSGTTLDPNTRVIEFATVGVKTKNTRSFSILNPTNNPYSFLWACEDPPNVQNSPAFRCLSQYGHILPEKRVEVTFEFVPQVLDITESFWSFKIPDQNISVPFLLVGKASEPCVSLDRSHLNFRSLLIGHEFQETIYLINNENKSFNFSFRECSLYSEGQGQSLMITPMEGTISALSRTPICIMIKPSQVGELNINLICDIKTKTEPLHLNVKAELHATDASVQFLDSMGTVTTLTQQGPNEIDLGKVDTNDCCTLQFNVLNNGQFPFSFSCGLSAPTGLQNNLSISPDTGTVGPGQKVHNLFTFHPTKKCVLKNVHLNIKIENGPEFRCSFCATAVSPGVNFSFTQHDFGNCFIYQAGMCPIKKTLIVQNKDKRDISLDCLYNNTAHLELDFTPDILPPGGQMEIPITFYPRAAVLYKETIIFQMNVHSKVPIHLQGRGIELKVAVANPKHKLINFGAVNVGQTVKKTIPVVNNSVTPVTCMFSIAPSVPVLQDTKVLNLLPTSEVTIPANGGVCKLELQFTPLGRITPFAEEVMLECFGVGRSLLVVRGCSQGLELSLDQDYIPFGAVVLQSQATRRIILSNTGDLGARFRWDIKKFQPDFSISPVSGYITAGAEVTFDITFHPSEISSDIHYDNLACFIEGSKTLMLTLSGSCVGLPSTKETVNFQCQVRSKQTQTIILTNKTNHAWTLQPIIDGEYWTGPDIFNVEANQQNKPYEITYRPLTMSLEGKKHQGSIFFPLPDGTGLMYLLQGVSEPPKSCGNIIREVPCKTSYTELLPISNWLNKSQRFRVTLEMVKPERLDSATSIKGLDYVEVPGAARRDYKLTFYSHKEGSFATKVTFRNETTQEYLYYFVTFKATPPGIISTIEMVAPVRQSTAATVKVDNPLLVPVTFTTDCKVQEINLPSQLTVPAQSEGRLTFEYLPLKTGESTGRLTLQSSDLGLFQYELLLKAMPALPEKPLYFRTTLGSNQMLNAKFTNYTRQRTEYSCKIDNSDFHVEKVVMAAPGSQGGSEVSVEVTYEPVQLGESQAVLFISSPLGGEYSIPLFGSAMAPKPQGPIQIRSGSSVSIPFKNVFLQPTAFTFQTDHPAFTVKPCEAVRPKKTHHISVSYETPHNGSKVPVTGKLVVSCPRATGISQGIFWVYYLKGVASEK